MAGVSAHFREDVGDKRAADRAMVGQPNKSYITWRLGASEDKFCLSYNSESFGGKTTHVDLTRLPDGSFKATVGHDATAFATLGDFVATRRYVESDAAVRTLGHGESVDDSAPSEQQRLASLQAEAEHLRRQIRSATGGDSTGAAAAAASSGNSGGGGGGLRHRAPAAAVAASATPTAASGAVPAPVGGRADVPASIALPAARVRGSGDPGTGDTVVPPTFSRRTFNVLFVCVGVAAAALALSAYGEYRTHEGERVTMVVRTSYFGRTHHSRTVAAVASALVLCCVPEWCGGGGGGGFFT